MTTEELLQILIDKQAITNDLLYVQACMISLLAGVSFIQILSVAGDFWRK
jgi:hypothetical protein